MTEKKVLAYPLSPTPFAAISIATQDCYAWLSPERKCDDNFYDSGRSLGEESGEELGKTFRAFSWFICCAERPTNLLPKFLPIYHSMSCGWNFKISSPRAYGVSLIFLAFLEKKNKENHPKIQGFFLCAEPLKSLGKKGKTLKKAWKFLATKSKEIQKSKERKIRVGGRKDCNFQSGLGFRSRGPLGSLSGWEANPEGLSNTN